MTRSTIYLRAITTIFAAILIYALTAIMGYDLITSSHTGVDIATIWPFLLFAIFPIGIVCVFLFFLPLAIYASFNPLRIIRALRDGNSAVLPPLSAQPGTDGALIAGESLHVESARSPISILREIFSQLAGLLVVAGMFEAFLLYFLPQQRTVLWTAMTNRDAHQLTTAGQFGIQYEGCVLHVLSYQVYRLP